MCYFGLEIEKRKQDDVPRLIRWRGSATSPSVTVGETTRERRDSETVILPIQPEDLYGQHGWVPSTRPLIVEVNSPRATPRETVAGCGSIFLVVEEGLVKQKTCTRRHRCRRCCSRPDGERDENGDKKDGSKGGVPETVPGREISGHHKFEAPKSTDHDPSKHHRSEMSALHALVDRIYNLLKLREERDEDWRQLRGELQKVKAGDRAERRKMKDIEKIVYDFAASPFPASPSPSSQGQHHRHLRHHDSACQCRHCHAPRVPPSTPSQWQGPYGCEPPKGSIPAGKRTHKHHKHRGREEREKENKPGRDATGLADSTMTDGSGSSESSKASQVIRESYDKVRNFALGQSRKLKAMDLKLKATTAKIDSTHDRLDQVEAGQRNTEEIAQKAEKEAQTAVTNARTANERVYGLGIRLDDGLAKTEVLGVQMKHVEARAAMAQRGVHELDVKVATLNVEGQIQRADVNYLTERVDDVENNEGLIIERQTDNLNMLHERIDAVENDVDGIDARQRSEERRQEQRWRDMAERQPAEVEIEEQIDVERVERIRRTRSRNRERTRDDAGGEEGQRNGGLLRFSRRGTRGGGGRFDLGRR